MPVSRGKYLRKETAKIKFSVNDILNQNKSITRTVGENYILDSRSNVIQRYFMLTFTFNLNRAGVGNNRNQNGSASAKKYSKTGGSDKSKPSDSTSATETMTIKKAASLNAAYFFRSKHSQVIDVIFFFYVIMNDSFRKESDHPQSLTLSF